MGQNQEMIDYMKGETVNLIKNAFLIGIKNPGFKGDFSENDLTALEKIIDELYPLGHKSMVTTLIPFGMYLGETIIRNIPGAEWDLSHAEEGDIFNFRVNVPSGENQVVTVMPFQRVRNFWFDREDGLAVMYRTINLFNLQFVNPEKLKEGEWKEFANGDKIRFFKANPSSAK